MSNFRYIVGFDADTKRCGLAMLDSHTGEIEINLYSYAQLVLDWLPNLVKNYNVSDVLVRVELPTIQTAIGTSKNQIGFKKSEKIYNSGRCSEIARQFKKLVDQYSIPAAFVKSEMRVRCDRKTLKELPVIELQKKSIQLSKQGRYLSKLEYRRAVQMFPSLFSYNEEMIDAALLVLPEALQVAV